MLLFEVQFCDAVDVFAGASAICNGIASASIGAIAGVPGYSLSGETYKGEGFEDEMLILKGFTGGMLDSFLHGFRKMKIQPVALKAVLTEANCGWNSLELHDELVKEHESMHSQTPSEVTDNKETE